MQAKVKEWPKFNILASNRRSKTCMQPYVARPGYKLVFQDVVAAEMMFLLNFCDDPNLKAILFDYQGKRPEWKDGILFTDSVYITGTSRTDFMRRRIDEVQKATKEDFCDFYARDSGAAKKALGVHYDVGKMIVLALIYGLQGFGVCRQMGERGFPVSKQYGEKFYNDFWSSFEVAHDFSKRMVYLMTKAFAAGRPILNPFGTPIPSGKPKDAMNRVIQSSVSTFIRSLEKELFPCDFAELLLVVHDEAGMEVREDSIERWRVHHLAALARVNELYQLTYPIQMGFSVGGSFYECK